MPRHQEDRRFTSMERPLRVLADLMRGKTHDRHSVAASVGIKAASGDRILQALARVIPGVKVEKGSRGRQIVFDGSRIAPPPKMSVAIAACFGASLANLFEGTPYQAGLRDVVRYVFRGRHRRHGFEHLERKFVFVRRSGEPNLAQQSGDLDSLVDALTRHHPVSIHYEHRNGNRVIQRLQPLSLAVYDHQLYLVARRADRCIHTYRFSRMQRVEVHEDTTFEYPPASEYDPQQVFRDSFGIFIGDDVPVERVTVKLRGDWARYARTHRWHPSQRVVPVEDDAVIVEFRVGICPELETWVLSCAEQAEVIEPARLRDSVRRRLEAARQTYAK